VAEPATPRREIDRSTAWVAAATGVLGLLDVVSTIVCLRLWVSTAAFGTATLAAALLPLIDRLAGSGLGAALVREVPSEHHDPAAQDATYASIFWLAVAVAAALLAALVALRGPIGAVFQDPVVGSLIAAFAARALVGTAGIVPDAQLRRALRFRALATVKVVANVVDTAVKLGLAYLAVHGTPALAVWCFVLGPVANTVTSVVGVQLLQPWWPRLVFRRAIAARAVRFAAALSGGDLLYYAYSNADYLVVGAWFGDAAVGAYRLAYELVLDVVRLLSMIAAEVAFPAFARLATDRAAVGAQLLRFTRQNLIVLAPVLAFLAIEADDLLALLYPPLPAAAATASRVLCGVGALRTLGFIVPPMLAGLGEARRVLVYNAIAAVVVPTAFVVAAAIAPAAGFVAVAWAWTASYPVAFVALLAMALPRAQLTVATYARTVGAIARWAAIAALAGLTARELAPDLAAIRAPLVAAVVLATFAAALARFEHVTPASIVRALRAPAAD
jgi:O-antigen/teichoic acid export membrane protein